MSVRLIAITKPVVDEVPDTQALLAYCARVSSTANQLNHETGPRLLQSLVNLEEWSPLEMVSLTMEITTTRDISRQMLRHRSFSFQEFSQRYAQVEQMELSREMRLSGTFNRQGSLDTREEDEEDIASICARAVFSLYRGLLQDGIARESARAILPEGYTPSCLYMAGTLRSWIHYTRLRMKSDTQKEHRVIAEQCHSTLVEQFPDLKEVL